MMEMRLSEIAKKLECQHVGADVAIRSVSIDTRTLQPSDFYVAIRGHNFDGNKFVDKAKDAGAVAAMLSGEISTDLPCIYVKDTRIGLGQLATLWRDKSTAIVIGITGSNGKTTVKEMTAAILSQSGSTLYTKGNLNNDIGVPLTLFKLDESHQYAVIEMGANHVGEIAYISKLAKPDVVILNNAGAAHLEGFKNMDGVAKGKGEIVETLQEGGVAILNMDDIYFDYWSSIAGERKIISFGLRCDADISARNIRAEIVHGTFVTAFELITALGEIKINLNLAGQHNVMNALAATGAALALDFNLQRIKQGLESMYPVTGRLQPLMGKKGNIIIDDTYNANPTSLKAGLDVLVNCKGEHWVVLGALEEIGTDSKKVHEEMGQFLNSKGVVRLLAVGPNAKHTVDAFGKGAVFFDSHEDLIKTLNNELSGNEAILVKGSRLQHMENVVAALVDNYRV